MDDKAVTDALRGMEASAQLLRLALTDYEVRPNLSKWGSEGHVDEIVARLGVFEVFHLAHELQMGESAVKRKLNAAKKRGTVIELSPASGPRPAVYRWSGKQG